MRDPDRVFIEAEYRDLGFVDEMLRAFEMRGEGFPERLRFERPGYDQIVIYAESRGMVASVQVGSAALATFPTGLTRVLPSLVDALYNALRCRLGQPPKLAKVEFREISGWWTGDPERVARSADPPLPELLESLEDSADE